MLIGSSVTGEKPTSNPLKPSITAHSHEQAWKNLINRTVPQNELLPLIETILSDREAIGMVHRLQESDAQAVIDVIYGVRHQTLFFEVRVDLPLLNFHIFSVRHWAASISHRASEGDVLSCCIRSVLATPVFPGCYKSNHATIQLASRTAAVGLQMCGRVNVAAWRSQSRC